MKKQQTAKKKKRRRRRRRRRKAFDIWLNRLSTPFHELRLIFLSCVLSLLSA
jgi:hypothetical protein